MTRLVDIGTIVAGLAAGIDRLAPELLPGGKREGREWVAGGLDGRPGHGVSVCLAGGKRGVWGDFSAGIHGDALDLVAHARCGGDKAEALRWARRWLGIDSGAPLPARPVAVMTNGQPQPDQDEAERQRKAKGLFLAGVPITGTPADEYLRCRGISLAELGRAPRALRFHPRVYCAERQAARPAMLAAVTRAGQHVGTHRTFLATDQRGRWVKAPIRDPKKLLGSAKGGCIPLWRGASDMPLRDAPDGDTVAIAEGIEDALTVALHCAEWRVVACISSGNMGAIALPPGISDVVLCLDRDGENAACRVARDRAATRFQAEGRRVREARPPEGFKDFNAWHQAQLQEGAA